MRNSKTTKVLYERLLAMPDLHSKPELDGEILFWKLYKNAYVRAYCDSYDTCIEIISNSVFDGSLVHWHPDEEDMLNDLYSLGKKGNMCVIKKTLLGSSVFYMGNPSQYPLSDRRSWDFGKKNMSLARSFTSSRNNTVG